MSLRPLFCLFLSGRLKQVLHCLLFSFVLFFHKVELIFCFNKKKIPIKITFDGKGEELGWGCVQKCDYFLSICLNSSKEPSH